MESKQQLRKYIKALKRSMPQESLDGLSDAICEAIMADAHVARAHSVMAFFPLSDEPDITPALKQLLIQGKRVLLPAVVGDNIELRDFDGDDGLVDGAYHIKEPARHSILKPDDIDVVLVPGVAFTVGGKRLGRGGGYYDRFLPKASNAWKIGVAFPFQMLDDIPTCHYDQKVDGVIVGKT